MNTQLRLATCYAMALAFSSPAFAQAVPANSELARALVGAWRVTSYSQLDVATGQVLYPVGEHPLGSIQFSPGGHMTLLVTASGREKRTPPYSVADRAAILDGLGSMYFGTYTVQGDKMTVHEVSALTPDNVGTDQVRIVELKGNQLTLKNLPSLNKRTGKISVTAISAEREE